MESQKTPNSNTPLNNKIGGMLSDFKQHYKFIVIKTVSGTGIKINA